MNSTPSYSFVSFSSAEGQFDFSLWKIPGLSSCTKGLNVSHMSEKPLRSLSLIKNRSNSNNKNPFTESNSETYSKSKNNLFLLRKRSKFHLCLTVPVIKKRVANSTNRSLCFFIVFIHISPKQDIRKKVFTLLAEHSGRVLVLDLFRRTMYSLVSG